jgi:hypothetical protein
MELCSSQKLTREVYHHSSAENLCHLRLSVPLWYWDQINAVKNVPICPSSRLRLPHYDPFSFSELVLPIMLVARACLDDFCNAFVPSNEHIPRGFVESRDERWLRRICPFNSIEL